MGKSWSLGRGGASYLTPDEKELYALLCQRVPRQNRLGHSDAVHAGRNLLEHLVRTRREVVAQLRHALDAHHQLIALTRDEPCPDCDLSENEVRDARRG